MEEWLILVTRTTVLIIDAMALIVVAFGTLQAFVSGVGLIMRPSATDHDRRKAWIRYGGWLVLGLTFQLAADIIETAITPTWKDVGQLGAIAVIRTFLNYFLEHDLIDVRERDKELERDRRERDRREKEARSGRREEETQNRRREETPPLASAPPASRSS
jgi:uncharacterized membrane protein